MRTGARHDRRAPELGCDGEGILAGDDLVMVCRRFNVETFVLLDTVVKR